MRKQIVRHHDERRAALLEIADGVEALPLEALVTDGERLVDENHLGVEVDRDRESEPHVHAGRVGPHGHVDEPLQLGEGDDVVEAAGDEVAGDAVERGVQEDVLAAGEIGAEAGAELEQRRDAPAGGDGAFVRFEDAGDDLEERALAAAVRADQAEGLAAGDLQGHVAQGPEGLAGLARAADRAQGPFFQAGRSAGERERLGNAVDGDRRRRQHRASVAIGRTGCQRIDGVGLAA